MLEVFLKSGSSKFKLVELLRYYGHPMNMFHILGNSSFSKVVDGKACKTSRETSSTLLVSISSGMPRSSIQTIVPNSMATALIVLVDKLFTLAMSSFLY